jgi:hypothetical protein
MAALAASVPAVARAADPAGELARRYAPVVRLVEQENPPCGHGEAFAPTSVDLVLGSPEVALRGPWDGSTIVKVAPTAQDLAQGLFGYHLDFPGSAVSPGCTYDGWSRRINAGHAPVAYAHIAMQRTRPGELALQYWFFYVFNDFNDKHEGDWEMIQLDFAAATPAQALRATPELVGYSQHEGAESAHWADDKLQLVDGTVASTTARRDRTRSCSGSSRSRGPIRAGTSAASRFRASRRSAQRRPASSAEWSARARAC